MISFLQIGCKGSTFCAHSQIKMHKNSLNVHTSAVLCMIFSILLYLSVYRRRDVDSLW